MNIAPTITATVLTVAAMFGARTLRHAAQTERGKQPLATAPFAPSPAAAPFVALGYREVAADLLSLRLVGYFAGEGDDAAVTASLVEAIEALDPRYKRIYEFGARSITLADTGVNNAAFLRAIGVLERGAAQFPELWKLPYLASQIYLQDLQTDDSTQRRAWDDEGLLLIESAIRKPNAPAEAAANAAVMRTKMGQTERAANELREMLLVTTDTGARARMIQKLATLQAETAEQVAAEILEQRAMFEKRWKRDRPAIPPTMYVVTGPVASASFDLSMIATGGRDLVELPSASPALPPLP
jgi:hypothetical protein